MNKCLLIIAFFAIFTSAQAQDFDTYFHPKALRFDYQRAGNSKNETIYFDALRQEPYYAGSKKNLIDTFGYGNHFFKVFDLASGELIYSRGHGSLFNEWQTTPEAMATSRSFPESLIMPFPKNKVRIELYTRARSGIEEKRFEYEIDPNNYLVQKYQYNTPVFEVIYSGKPENCIDVVLIPEGYSSAEKDKFEKDCKLFASELLGYSPYKENASKFNIRGVWQPSLQSGVTIPGENIWSQTATNARFYTFDTERYQMIEDYQNLCDIAGNAPYDVIYVLSNTKKYGGGGIYNFYGISSAGHPDKAGKVYVHEFGHLLIGLGDEYVGGTETSEFYPLTVEPWEANITTLVDFGKKDWSKMLDPKTKIPTEVTAKAEKILGVYEGAGYVTKGVYRPWVNCLMNNLHNIDEFCPVCIKATNKVIEFNTK